MLRLNVPVNNFSVMSGRSEDWSDWVNAQADLSLRWVHTHFVGFVMRLLICLYGKKNQNHILSVFLRYWQRYCLAKYKSISAATWQNQQSDCAPSEDSDQPGRTPSLIRVFADHKKKACVLSYPCLRLAHTHFVGFVTSRLICNSGLPWKFDKLKIQKKKKLLQLS